MLRITSQCTPGTTCAGLATLRFGVPSVQWTSSDNRNMIASPHNQWIGGATCLPKNHSLNIPFERTSKRRRGFPSETQVKRGDRLVRGNKDLSEKLGRNDPCPCGSARRFQELLPQVRQLRWFYPRPLLLGSDRLQNKYGQRGRPQSGRPAAGAGLRVMR